MAQNRRPQQGKALRLARRRDLDADTLRDLSGLPVHGAPVVSIYLDLDAKRFPTPGAREAELRALLAQARHQVEDDAGHHGEEVVAAIAQVRELVEADPAVTRGARALAIFSAAEEFLEVVRLSAPIEPLAVVDSVPWLEPLAGALAPDVGGVALLGRRSARLFRGSADALVEFAHVDDEVHRRHAQGGWSQARFQRGIEEQVGAHVRHVARLLSRADRRRPFEQLVIVASSELWPMLEAALPTDLRRRVAGVVDADLGRAGTDEIQRAVGPVLSHAERERERALIARLEQALADGAAAAAGLDEVLSMLADERVDTLIVEDDAGLVAGLCPRCARLYASADTTCRVDGSALGAVDAIEHAVERAARQSAQVVVVRHETSSLGTHGAIAALLRW